MIEKLAALEERYNQLTTLVSDPAILADQATWQKHVKARADLEEVVLAYQEYKKCLAGIEDAKILIKDKSDPEMAEMAQLELDELKAEEEEISGKLTRLLLPKDPNDSKNVILEIRAGTGGDEAGLFAGDLFKMYSRYAEKNNWHLEVLNA
ncbi:MAG: PCRF domain-containing protein, partial [Clostridiales bacterium]